MTKTKHTRRGLILAGAASLVLPTRGLSQSEGRVIEGGIGGTGIVGISIDAQRLVVAGRALRTDALTRVTDAYGAVEPGSLHLGASLTVEASGPETALTARRIHITHPLVGVVSDVSPDGRQIRVNGTLVALAAPAPLATIGTRVAVSGVWRGVEVVASAVRPARDPRDIIAGTVTRAGFAQRVGAIAVRGAGARAMVDAGFASVIGQFDPEAGIMRAQSTQTARFTGAAGPLERLAIEGYLEPVPEAPGYRVAGLGHSFERNIDLSPYAATRALFLGDYTGLFAARQAVALPEQTSARHALLRRLSRA